MTNLYNWWRSLVPSQPRVLVPGAFSPPIALREAAADAQIQTYLDKPDLGRRIHLAFVQSADDISRLQDALFANRIDAVAYAGDAAISSALAYFHFECFGWSGGGLRKFPFDGIRTGMEVIAAHPRFSAPHTLEPLRLEIAALAKRFNAPVRGVIHVGAGDGNALDSLSRAGASKMLLVESNPALFAKLAERVRGRQGVLVYQGLMGERNGMEVLEVVGEGGVRRKVPVPVRRLDYLLRELNQNPGDFNYLHLSLGGDKQEEGRVLRGAAGVLPWMDVVTTEIAYDVPGGVEELDAELATTGYERVFTATPSNPMKGDAFYLRQPAVSMRNLAVWGRFGNQVFEYAFVHIFGKRHRLRVETSQWPGNQLFGATDPFPSRQYPQHIEQTYALADSQVARTNFRPINFDVCGVFQYHTTYYAPHKEYFRQLLTPVPALKGMLDEGLHRARGGAKTLVAMHLRRGDYGYGLFFIPPNAWYQKWLKALWPTLDNPVLYIATDEPAKVLPDFAEYKPVTAADLKVPSFGADYYPDYYVLSQADHLAISNSSFSFSACMLNERSKTFMRPDLFVGDLISFDPWDTEPLLHRELGILDHKQVAQALPHYLQRPNDPQLLNFMRNARAQTADSFSQIRGDQIDLVLTLPIFGCYQNLQKANMRPQPLVDAEKQILSRIMDRLNRGIAAGGAGGKEHIGPYIAATMFVPAAHLPAVDLSSVPSHLQEVIRT